MTLRLILFWGDENEPYTAAGKHPLRAGAARNCEEDCVSRSPQRRKGWTSECERSFGLEKEKVQFKSRTGHEAP